MSRYTPVRTTMDTEDNYNSPFDHHETDSDAHYEAPSCLKRNPSGSLFIPSSQGEAENTLPLESRIKHSAYSPHHTLRSYSPPESSQPSIRHENAYTNSTSVYNVGSLGTRLGNTLLSRGGVSGGMGGAPGSMGGPHSPTRSPNTEKFTNLDSHRTTLPNYGSSGQLTVYPHPGAHTFHNGTSKRPNSSSQSSQSFRLKSDLSQRCSWKFLAIFFILFSFLLVSALIYTAASNIVLQSSTSLEKAQACPVIEESPDKNFLPKSGIEYEKEYSKKKALIPSFQGLPDLSTFRDLRLDVKLAHIIQPYTFWNFKVQQMDSVYVQFDFNLPRGASIGLYARRNAIPTFTNNDIRDVMKGYREKRSTNIHRNYNYYFESGHWFISLYNDDSEPREIEMSVSVREDLTAGCPRGCSRHGECIGGQCVCQTGFHGADCSESSCPVLCNGNGEYEQGVCKCYPGWKGVECSVRHNECEVADCNNRGDCQNGECVCSRGYTGKFCEEVDCVDPSCSGHGSCLHGLCHCVPGYTGSTCARKEMDQNCPQTCSSRGMFDIQLGVCRCDPGYYGEDCSRERCEIDCGDHGECSGKVCVCSEGWSGPLCNVKLCDSRCSAHGMCSNGTCLCTNGWNGKHCTLEGCPGNCNGHGTCSTNYELEWECMCEGGWYGQACDIQLEASCDDRIDNDQDGLVDCEDPECCESPVCERSQLCHTVSSPIDILLRKQPPSITAPFYERMKFIIEDNGLQSYAQKVGFNESRAAVVRGQVITPSGMGLIGVRVSTNGVNEGFTMTRDDGWFDLMVNGGGPVMLQFGRNPYSPLRLSLYVPWNEVVVLSAVQLGRTEVHVQVPELYTSIPTCTPHDYNRMQPVILSSWHTNYRGGTGSNGAVLAESRILRESLDIPGTDIKLVYISSRAKGFYSTLQLQLTPEGSLPDSLVRVHLTISIEGVLDQKVFEADPLLQYTYAWDRLNVYRQRVYGVTTANIKVGYEYSGCDMVWIAKTAKVAGHDMTLSDIGGWNLDVQHKYNYHEGILQKGDGSNLYLKYTPLVVTTVVGNGQPRPAECGKGSDLCEGKSSTQSLLAPKSLTVGPDGSIYVADYDLIRKITTDGEVRTVRKLNGTRVGYRYHLAHRVYTRELEHRQALYISMPHQYRIVTLKDLNGEGFEDESNGMGTTIGNGERCLPGDQDNCGDGGKAENARLTYPKGIAIGPDGKVYFADGNNIRMVDENGIMHTVVGHQNHRSNWKPIPCDKAVSVDEVQLNWPTGLAINPLDGTLHFIDDNMVMQLTNDGRIKIVAGRPLHCPPPPNSNLRQDDPQSSGLLEPQAISFSANGELYIAESDSKRVNRVRRVVHNTIEIIAGGDTSCNCMEKDCSCFDPDSYLASSTSFSAISSLAVSPDGKIYVADEGNLRIRAIASQMPTKEDDEVFEVPDPGAQELYIFNRYSQHILTKDLLTKSLIYSMEYSQATSTGKLVSVTDASGRKLAIVRDYSNQITALQTSNGDKHALKINRMGYLEKFETPSGYSVEFHYMSSTGLLESKLDSQNYGYVYKYDNYGRLVQSVAPTGEITFLHFNLTSSGGNINVGDNVVSIKENRVTKRSLNGGPVKETVFLPDKSLQVNIGPRTVTLKMIPHPVISHSQPVIGGSYPMVGKVDIEASSSVVSQLEWFYNLQTSGHDKQLLGITKMLQVNKENLLVVSFDKLQSREVLYLPDRTQLLEIKYDEASRPVSWAPSKGSFAPTIQKYDRFGLLELWQRGDTQEKYSYDKNGRLVTIQHSNATFLALQYKDRETVPFKVSTGKGASYQIDYDSTTGSVKSVTTPRGHIHTWRLQPNIDAITWMYSPPWSSQPVTVRINSRGFIDTLKLSGNGQVSFDYSSAGNIQHIFAGRTEIEWSLDAALGLPESVYLSQPGLDLKEKRKYHNGIMKEQKFRFSGNSNFENTFVKYQCDGVGRPARVQLTTGSKRERSAPDQTWTYNQNTGNLEAVDNFQISQIGYTRTEIKEKSGSFMKTIDLDILGNIKRILYSVKRQKIFELKFEYNAENYLLHTAITDESGRDTKTSYAYTVDGHLDKSWGNINYDFSYDENGNMVMQSKDSRLTNLAFGPGDRVESFSGKKVAYDADGFVTIIDQEKYLFNALGQLIEYISSREAKVNYYYDSNGRLLGWTDSTGESAQYFYTNPVEPNQVTYAQTNRLGGSIQKLSYDSNGHLIQIESNENGVMYVVCDQFGSPLLVFQPNGNIVKRMGYSPFGEVTEDSKPSVFIPLGFQGMLYSRHGQFLMTASSKVYSSQINQWLNPDFTQLMQEIHHPSDLFIYRFKNNNPINPGKRNYMTDINSWASVYGFNIDNIFHGVSQSLDTEPVTMIKHKISLNSVIPANGLQFETDDLVSSAVDRVKDLSFIHPIKSVIESRRRNIVPRFSSLPPNFGRGFLLSLVDGNLAVVSSVETKNSVVQNIFESVLNNSIYLDVSFSDSSKSVYYFVKPNMNKFSLDSDTVRRLAGEFSVSHKEIDRGQELSIINSKFEVRILYGAQPDVYRSELIKTFAGLAVTRAWAIEKEIVTRGFTGSINWTPSEISELLRSGKVRGYEASEVQPVDKFPALALDGTNREFNKIGQRGRKNRHGRRKHAQDY